ncbi:MAG: hypothetical protein SFX73_38390 [Kofleriaceae bacterium]|nr:hypothetical protein [Kofleriaceae bacterium]
MYVPLRASFGSNVIGLGALVLASMASGCGDAGNDGGGADGGTGAACAEQQAETDDGVALTGCTRLFDAPPYIRLPADSASHAYVGIQDGKLVSRTTTYADAATVLLQAESERYGHLIYRATLTGGIPTKLEPAVRIDDRAMQQLLAGRVLEGTVSPRNPGDEERPFAFDQIDKPIRVELDAAPSTTAHDEAVGYPRFSVGGRIANATHAVQGADGTCLPALSGLGDANPLLNAADDRVFVLRHPNMHGAFDDVFTFDWPAGVVAGNNMGPGLFVSTIALAGMTAFAPTAADSTPHGTPWGGPSTTLSVVTGGGATCTP